MFEGLKGSDRERLAKHARELRLTAGDVLMTEGDPANELFVIEKGTFEISRAGDEAEVKLGCLDAAPTTLVPGYELWVKRREPWLPAVPGAEQFEQDRP